MAKLREYLFGCISILVLSVFLISCEKELYDEHIHHESVIKEISLDKFLRETGIKDFKKQIKVKSNTGLQAARNPDGSYELSDFVIDTEIIKRFVYNEKITYTFRILPVEEEIDNKYFNIIYYFDNGWQTKILEYTPTEENLILLKSNLTERFEGTLNKVFQSGLPNQNEGLCDYWVLPVVNCIKPGNCLPNNICDKCVSCMGAIEVEICDDPVGITYIDSGPSTGGGPTTGSGPVSGTSDGSSGTPTTNNDDEIATSPVFENPALQVPLETPCNELVKMTSTVEAKNAINDLRGKTGNEEESGYLIRKNNNTGNHQSPTPLYAGSIPNQIPSPLGSNIIGQFHTHPIDESGYYPMFSDGDIYYLSGIADRHVNNGQEKNYSEYFLTLTVPEGTYAIKIKDYEKFQNFMANGLWRYNQYEKLTEKYKRREPTDDIKGMQYDLLSIFKEYDAGLGLYEVNHNLESWEEIKLNPDYNPNDSSSNPTKKEPCN